MPKSNAGVLAELRPPPAVVRPALATNRDAEPSVTLTRGELRSLMREAAFQGAAEALAELKRSAAAPTLLSVQKMAEHLGVSRSKVNAMRLAGCPAVRLGSIFRFSPPAVLAWLEKHGGGNTP